MFDFIEWQELQTRRPGWIVGDSNRTPFLFMLFYHITTDIGHDLLRNLIEDLRLFIWNHDMVGMEFGINIFFICPGRLG